MSNHILKSFAAVGIAAVMIFGATACSSAPTSPSAPATVGSDSSAAYTEEYVEQSDGSIVRCLWWNKGYTSSNMSCDFDNAVPAPAE